MKAGGLSVACGHVSLLGATLGDLLIRDAAYDIALVGDGSPTGLTPGNTVAGGALIFVNVDPGTVTPTITTPSGESCEMGHDSFEVVAGAYNNSTYYCN